jgi:hypothetical protein
MQLQTIKIQAHTLKIMSVGMRAMRILLKKRLDFDRNESCMPSSPKEPLLPVVPLYSYGGLCMTSCALAAVVYGVLRNLCNRTEVVASSGSVVMIATRTIGLLQTGGGIPAAKILQNPQ